MNTVIKKEDGSKEEKRSVCSVQKYSLSSRNKEDESKMTSVINLPKHSSSDTVVNGSTERLLSEISAYDSSRACLLPNGNLTISNSDLDIKCRNERFKCMIPFKYDKDYMFNFSNRIFLRNEIYSSKFFLTDVMNLESSEEDIKNNMDAKPLTKRLGKTLMGWDKLGMHYWLSRMNKSRRLMIETVPSDPWFHVHICEKCLQQLKFQCNLCQTTMFLPENVGTLLYETNTLQNDDGKPTEYESNDSIYDSEYEDDTDGLYCSKKCSEQYFKRIVYSTNGCGLNFKFPEEPHFSREPVISRPNLNPFMRVVVFGTDPCGLNFPVDLETLELDSDSSNEKFFLPYELRKDDSEFNLSSDFFSTETGGKETDCDISDKLEAKESKEAYFNDFVSPLPLIGSSYKGSESSIMTLSEFSGNDMENLEDIILIPSVDDLSGMKEQVHCKTNLEVVKCPNNKKSDTFLNRTMADTDIGDARNSKTASSQLKISTSKRLSLSTITNSSISLVLLPRSSTNFRKAYCLTYPENINMIEFSLYRKFNKRSKRKPRYINLKLARRQIRKRRKGKFLLHFPDSSSMKVRMIAIGKNYNRIFIQKKSSEVVNISKKHTIFKIDAIPFFMQVIIYVFLLGAFTFIFILMEEIWKSIRSTPPKRQWYHGF